MNIRSDFPLLGLPAGSASEEADARIQTVRVPGGLPDAINTGPLYQAGKRTLLLNIPAIARYRIADGRVIDVEQLRTESEQTIRLFLLGPAIGALLLQTGIPTFHASAVIGARGAVLFAGPSACGKSTLAYALALRGYAVLTDEICPVRIGSTLMAVPGYPHVMLWEDSLLELGIDPLRFERARPELSKFIVPLGPYFSGEPMTIDRICILEPTTSGDITAESVRGIAKVQRLIEQTYRGNLLADMDLEAEYLPGIISIAEQVPVLRVQVPRFTPGIKRLTDWFERNFLL